MWKCSLFSSNNTTAVVFDNNSCKGEPKLLQYAHANAFITTAFITSQLLLTSRRTYVLFETEWLANCKLSCLSGPIQLDLPD